jgi:hypothetical protein
MRHIFNSWIVENLVQFNDNQLQEISIDVGDTAKNLPTHRRYRISLQENADMDKTEIEGNIHDNEYARNVMLANIEEGGSVGNVADVADVADVDEVNSPSPVSGSATKQSVLDTMRKYYELKLKWVEKQLQILDA